MVRVWLGHGAWGTPASMAPWVDGLAARGVAAAAVALPRGQAARAAGAFAAQVPDMPGVVVGGHSFGGRAATLLAARSPGTPQRRHPVAGVVALSFPLHPPRRPDPACPRAAHWLGIEVPVLLLAGDADPYADLVLLRISAARLPRGELVVYPGLGHDLSPVRDDALDRIAAFARSLAGRDG